MPKQYQAILWVIVSAAGFNINFAVLKHLEKFYSMYLLGFMVMLLASIWLIPFVIRNYRLLNISMKGSFILRGILEAVCFSMLFIAITMLPLPTLTALNFIRPLLMIILGIWLLSEKSSNLIWITLFASAIGMLIITRPTIMPYGLGTIYLIISSIGFAYCGVIIKRLVTNNDPNIVTFYMFIITPIFLSVPAIYHWQWINNIEHIGLLILASSGFFIGQIGVSKSLSMASLGLLSPFQFTNLIFASILGWKFFDEVIDIYTMIGAIIILVSVSILAFYYDKK